MAKNTWLEAAREAYYPNMLNKPVAVPTQGGGFRYIPNWMASLMQGTIPSSVMPYDMQGRYGAGRNMGPMPVAFTPTPELYDQVGQLFANVPASAPAGPDYINNGTGLQEAPNPDYAWATQGSGPTVWNPENRYSQNLLSGANMSPYTRRLLTRSGLLTPMESLAQQAGAAISSWAPPTLNTESGLPAPTARISSWRAPMQV